jgi:mRNA interferase RelE/StbE
VYRISILDRAARELSQIDKPVARRIIERINWLNSNLDIIKIEPLTGDLAGLYKLRVGDYRIIYEILHNEQTLIIHAIGHRKEIYRMR